MSYSRTFVAIAMLVCLGYAVADDYVDESRVVYSSESVPVFRVRRDDSKFKFLPDTPKYTFTGTGGGFYDKNNGYAGNVAVTGKHVDSGASVLAGTGFGKGRPNSYSAGATVPIYNSANKNTRVELGAQRDWTRGFGHRDSYGVNFIHNF